MNSIAHHNSEKKDFDLFASSESVGPAVKELVEFRINYKTDFGQVMCVVGNTHELGKNT